MLLGLRGRPPAWPLGVLVVLVAAGCGLRSDPLEEFVGSGADGGGGEGCDDPIELPLVSTVARGRVAGVSEVSGGCGFDGGPEDVYMLRPDLDTDVQIIFRTEETDFEPILRVQEGGCSPDEGTTAVCSGDVFQVRHFYARAGLEYFIVVDSAQDIEGEYAFDVIYGPPPITACNVHPTTVLQEPGSVFVWDNAFDPGQRGTVFGNCGGPGRENMFQIQWSYPGSMFALLESFDGYEGVLNVRTGCGAATELTCINASTGGGGPNLQLDWFLSDPNDYYLVVDQEGSAGGSWRLTVAFE